MSIYNQFFFTYYNKFKMLIMNDTDQNSGFAKLNDSFLEVNINYKNVVFCL